MLSVRSCSSNQRTSMTQRPVDGWVVESSRGTEWKVAILLRCPDPEGIHIPASQTNALRSLLEKSRCPAAMVNRPWSTSSSDTQTGRPLIVLTAASCFRVGQLLVHRKKVGEGIRIESWSSKKSTKQPHQQTNKTANCAPATSSWSEGTTYPFPGPLHSKKHEV